MNEPAPTTITGTVAGICWMVFTTLCFVAVTGLVRYVGTTLPAAETAFIRYGLGTVFFLPFLVAFARQGVPAGSIQLFGWRGLVHGVGVILWFYAMARTPVADITALGFIVPIFVSLGAVLFLGERFYARRLAFMGIGLAGVLIILRPGFADITSGHFAQLAAAPLFATSYLLAKRLSRDIRPVFIVAVLSLSCTVVLAPFALADWVRPSATETGWLALTALFATAGHYALTRAIHSAPLTVTQPISLLQLVWASLLGIFVFGEAIDPYVIVGGALVLTATIFLARHEMIASYRASASVEAIRSANTGHAPKGPSSV